VLSDSVGQIFLILLDVRRPLYTAWAFWWYPPGASLMMLAVLARSYRQHCHRQAGHPAPMEAPVS
jgi:hypothetical protein